MKLSVVKVLPDARISKRPLMHPPISSMHSGPSQPKVVYISTSTKFIAAVKRVRKLLSEIDKRSMGSVDLLGKKTDISNMARRRAKRKEKEEVVLKASARAIEKALGLALFFRGQRDCTVRLRTGSVGVVDDVEKAEHALCTEGQSSEKVGEDGGSTVGPKSKEGHGSEEDLPETQVRRLGTIEVAIRLR